MQFAVSINWIAEDPTQGIKVKLPRTGEGYRAWGEEQIVAFRNRHALGTRQRLALELLLNTAQRRGDAIRMGPQHVRNGKLHVRQQKTGVKLVLDIAPELQAAIDAMPSAERHLTFVVTPAGKPYLPEAFSHFFRKACEAAGLHGFSAHGLRKAAMRRMAEAGCTVHEIVAWSGHQTLAQVAHYTRSVEQERLAEEAMAKTRTKVSKSGGQIVKTGKKAKEING